jgi:hypothetical protein
MAEFKMELISHWSDGIFTVLSDRGSAMETSGTDVTSGSDAENEIIEDINEN